MPGSKLGLADSIRVFAELARIARLPRPKTAPAGGLPFDVRLPLAKRENYKAWLESKAIANDSNHWGCPVEEALAELKR